MQPTLCSRCKKNVAVIFITRIENGESHNEGLCLRCARELHIKPVDEMMEELGISDDDLDTLTAREGGLEDVGGVHAALGVARADDVVHLVDDKDDVAHLADLLDEPLHAALELTAELGACHKGRQVQQVDLFIL